MKIISHRGNLNGPGIEENNPKQIDKVLIETNFDVEVDVWKVSGQWFLGHDKPQYKIHLRWLYANNERLWLHAKNIHAYCDLLQDKRISQVFWHEKDCYTLVKNWIIWAYPNQQLTPLSVANIHGKINEIPNCYGICTDYPYSIIR